MTESNDLSAVLDKLRRYGTARDREADFETRTLTITDDEALAILAALEKAGIA